MIHSLLKMEFNQAVSSSENLNNDGSINWNFVDADCYMAVGKLYKDAKAFYEDFNDLADTHCDTVINNCREFQTSLKFK